MVNRIVSENFLHWSKFKAHSHNILFSWNVDLLSLTLVYFLPNNEILSMNTNLMWNQSWNKNKYFHLFLILKMFGFFKCKVRTPSKWFLTFLSFMNSFWEAVFFKISAFKNFAIFWRKKRLNMGVFLFVLWILQSF